MKKQDFEFKKLCDEFYRFFQSTDTSILKCSKCAHCLACAVAKGILQVCSDYYPLFAELKEVKKRKR